MKGVSHVPKVPRRAEGIPVRGIYAGMRRRGAIVWPLAVWELQRGKLAGCLHAFIVCTPSKGSSGGPHSPQLMIKHQGRHNVAMNREDGRGGADGGRGYLEHSLGHSGKRVSHGMRILMRNCLSSSRLHRTDLHCKVSSATRWTRVWELFLLKGKERCRFSFIYFPLKDWTFTTLWNAFGWRGFVVEPVKDV